MTNNLNMTTVPNTSSEVDPSKPLLLAELNKGVESAKTEGWVSEEEMWHEFWEKTYVNQKPPSQ